MRAACMLVLLATGCGEGWAYFSCPSRYWRDVRNHAPVPMEMCGIIDRNTELAIQILSRYGIATPGRIESYLADITLKVRAYPEPWWDGEEWVLGLYMVQDPDLAHFDGDEVDIYRQSIEVSSSMWSLAHEIMHAIEYNAHDIINSQHVGWKIYDPMFDEYHQAAQPIDLIE